MIEFFDIDNVVFRLFGVNVSWLELAGLITGLIAVGLSSRRNIWSWPIGIVNVVLSFFLFYQSLLYPDMFLQIFFFVTNIVGWWRWTNPRKGEEDKRSELKVSYMTRNQLVLVWSVGIVGTSLFALFASRLHEWFPSVFSLPSAAPFLDSFITVVSILAQYYMMQKKVECWVMWLAVDIVATYVYFTRDIMLYSILYFIFCWMAVYALWNWRHEHRSYRAAGI